MAAKWKVRLTYKMLDEGKSNEEINDALNEKVVERDTGFWPEKPDDYDPDWPEGND